LEGVVPLHDIAEHHHLFTMPKWGTTHKPGRIRRDSVKQIETKELCTAAMKKFLEATGFPTFLHSGCNAQWF
jgi:hypothetical protein